MYARFFGLKQEPFSIAPDPRYLFMSERHREALAHLLYGVNGGGGFVLLTGEIGAGKTTVCRCFLEQVPKRCNVAYIFNPRLTAAELLATVCDEFRIPRPEAGSPGAGESLKELTDRLNQFLLRTHAVGQNNLLIIDEAQSLSAEVLEQLRLLTNLETNERKLLQIILIGQPELRTLLARPELEQLAQRVIARYHLQALSERETRQYIRHRLGIAGLNGPLPFDKPALLRIHELARGVPRRINLLADRALLGAYGLGRSKVDRSIVDKAASEVFDQPREQRRRAAAVAVGVAALAVAIGLGVVLGRVGGAGSAAAGDGAASAAARSAGFKPPVAGASAAAPAASAVATAASAAAPLFLTAAELRSLWPQAAEDEASALRELAAVFDARPGEGDPCAAGRPEGWLCFRNANTTLGLIRQLDRPGVLTLRDAEGRPLPLLLTALDEGTATLRSGDTTRTVSLLSLAGVWRGEYTTFWRPPPGWRDGDAAVGASADWLASRLAALHGEDGSSAADGADLRGRVLAFQRANGLRPDGVAGPVTLMLLNRSGGLAAPRLQRKS